MIPSKYTLTPPEDLHPLNFEGSKPIYPDFDPWSHTQLEDKILLNFVSKGYYNSAKVNFESISARSSLQESLPTVSTLLADQLSNVLHIREQDINKISSVALDANSKRVKFNELAGPGFSLPTRVTLTDHRRELWLQEISSPHASLSNISKSIPHGLKRRQVLEQCFTKQIPISRAVWLIKCSYSIEWKILTSKQKHESSDEITNHLYKEWTDNMAHILEKLVFEMTQYYNEPIQLRAWKKKISYYLKLLGNCYTINLLDKNIFHHWLVEFVGKVENFECIPLTLHIMSVFWDGLCQKSESTSSEQIFLVNKITEALLYKYYMVSRSKSMINDEQYLINDVKKNSKLKELILAKLKGFILRVFHEQSLEAFIMSNNNWDIYKNCLYEILGVDKQHETGSNKTELKKKLELIVYRNDSLKFNSVLQDNETSDTNISEAFEGSLESLFIKDKPLKLKRVDYGLTTVLDDNSPGDDWVSYVDQKLTRIDQVIQMIMWAIHPSRASHYEGCQLIAKLLLLKINSQNSFQEYNIEDTVWALIFRFAKLSSQEMNTTLVPSRLYQLLNIFIGYGLIKVPTYVRKLISSGILYLSESQDKYFHCELLVNLKIAPLMKSQYNMVLKNVKEYDPSFFENFNYDKLMEMLEVAKSNVLAGDFAFVETVPYSVKVLSSEWYLNFICTPTDNLLEPVDKENIINKLKVFCINMKEFHHFYKWVEFIVYHQLLKDISALECLVDILMFYDKLFPLLINDHILLMKTLLHLYSKELALKDPQSYQVYAFNHFWKFFTRKFPFALEIDGDLQMKLAEVYESEKLRMEKIAKSYSMASELYDQINRSTPSSGSEMNKLESHNFPSLFQKNIKLLLNSKDEGVKYSAKTSMRLLLNLNPSEYNKFMSVFLKRKDFTDEQLKHLISLKVLSFEQINKVLGEPFLLKLLDSTYFDLGLTFELQKHNYIKQNFKDLLNAYQKLRSDNNISLFNLIIIFNTSPARQDQSCNTLYKILKSNDTDYLSTITNLLGFGTKVYPCTGSLECVNNDETDDEGDHTIEELSPVELFEELDFANLWIFQVFTKYYLEILSMNAANDLVFKKHIFDIIDVTGDDLLCSKIFDRISDVTLLERLLCVVEIDFFEKCLSNRDVSLPYFRVIIEIITNLSRKLNKISGGVIAMHDRAFNLLQLCAENFASMLPDELLNSESKLDVYLKVMIVHQQFVFRKCIDGLQTGGPEKDLICHLCKLFGKVGFSLKVKLLLYDILTSLKSFTIYASTRKSHSNMAKININVPKELLDLPPFRISSFMKSDPTDDDSADIHLGIVDDSSTERQIEPKYFIFNKKTLEYDCKLVLKPFHLLINYQEAGNGPFNNTSLSMSLFNASFDKKNPT